MFDKLKNLICEYVEVSPDSILPESNLRLDLGLNSLDIANLSVAIEDEFGIAVPGDRAAAIFTVGELMKYMDNYAK